MTDTAKKLEAAITHAMNRRQARLVWEVQADRMRWLVRRVHGIGT